jgi:hypothetical protein
MKLKIALAGVLLAGLALPALAQTTTSYYITQDVKTKHCQVVDIKPQATETTIIGGDGQMYKTRTEAEGAMGTAKVCTTD